MYGCGGLYNKENIGLGFMLEFKISWILQIFRRIRNSLAENGWELWYAILNIRASEAVTR
jgi:hypothetical protein